MPSAPKPILLSIYSLWLFRRWRYSVCPSHDANIYQIPPESLEMCKACTPPIKMDDRL